MSLRSFTSAACAAVFLVGANARAATLSITSGPTFDVGTPALTSSVSGQLIGGNLIKISGNATFIQQETPINTVTMTITGTFTVSRGEGFILDYDFTGILSSLASVPYVLEVDATAGIFPLGTVVSDDGVFTPGTSVKSESDVAEAPSLVFDFLGETVSGTFTARLIMNTENLVAGDTMELQIPNNSIDLYAGVVPEPSAILLSGVALLGLAGRRRR